MSAHIKLVDHTPEQIIARYICESYALMAQIDILRRQMIGVQAETTYALSSQDIPVAERNSLFADFYWEAIDLPTEPIVTGFGYSSLSALLAQIKLPHVASGISCACGKALTVGSRSAHAEIHRKARKAEKRGYEPPRCSDCAQSESLAWQKEREQREADLRARVAALRSMPYAQYLRTPHWQATRAAALKRARYRCQLCGVNQWVTLDVHHSTYERRGHELPADLIVLCRTCHETHHDKLAEDRS